MSSIPSSLSGGIGMPCTGHSPGTSPTRPRQISSPSCGSGFDPPASMPRHCTGSGSRRASRMSMCSAPGSRGDAARRLGAVASALRSQKPPRYAASATQLPQGRGSRCRCCTTPRHCAHGRATIPFLTCERSSITLHAAYLLWMRRRSSNQRWRGAGSPARAQTRSSARSPTTCGLRSPGYVQIRGPGRRPLCAGGWRA